MAAAPEDDTQDPTIAELIAARPQLRLHAMDGLLLDGVPLHRIADAAGTPTWAYSAATIRGRYRTLTAALTDPGLDAHVHSAAKATAPPPTPSFPGRGGAGADVASGGDPPRARAAAIPAARIVYSGVGKSERELRLALTED